MKTRIERRTRIGDKIKKKQKVTVVSGEGSEHKAKMAGYVGFRVVWKIDNNREEAANSAIITGFFFIATSNTMYYSLSLYVSLPIYMNDVPF